MIEYGLLFKDIVDALCELEAKRNLSADGRQPYMQPEFEALRQYQAASLISPITNTQGLLDLLSGKVTSELLGSSEPSQGWQLFSKITLATGIGGKDTAFAPIRNILPISVLKKMYVDPTKSPHKSSTYDCYQGKRF